MLWYALNHVVEYTNSCCSVHSLMTSNILIHVVIYTNSCRRICYLLLLHALTHADKYTTSCCSMHQLMSSSILTHVVVSINLRPRINSSQVKSCKIFIHEKGLLISWWIQLELWYILIHAIAYLLFHFVVNWLRHVLSDVATILFLVSRAIFLFFFCLHYLCFTITALSILKVGEEVRLLQVKFLPKLSCHFQRFKPFQINYSF